MNRLFLPSFLAILLLSGATPGYAEYDVDEADSLDFGSFHQKDDERLKLWEQNQSEKTEATAIGEKIQSREPLPTTAKGSASQTLDRLYRKMLEACPQGWDQLREWAATDNGVPYLYKEFKCRAG